ncbi:hypothetical protein BZA77DRAFT_355302 [Pyronema omphalodes]|nr:hypothetical protein BZA77DRAFT_355302 [Pyronema omphalodes]
MPENTFLGLTNFDVRTGYPLLADDYSISKNTQQEDRQADWGEGGIILSPDGDWNEITTMICFSKPVSESSEASFVFDAPLTSSRLGTTVLSSQCRTFWKHETHFEINCSEPAPDWTDLRKSLMGISGRSPTGGGGGMTRGGGSIWKIVELPIARWTSPLPPPSPPSSPLIARLIARLSTSNRQTSSSAPSAPVLISSAAALTLLARREAGLDRV